MVSVKLRCSVVWEVWDNKEDIPIIPFIGVRISWLMVARNILFALFACTASSTDDANWLVRLLTSFSSFSFCFFTIRMRMRKIVSVPPTTKNARLILNHHVSQKGGTMVR